MPSPKDFKVPKIRFGPEQQARIGAKVIETVKNRIASELNAYDAPAKAYSERGPIYIPIVGSLGKSNEYGKKFRGRLGGVGYNRAAGSYILSKRFASRMNQQIAAAFGDVGDDAPAGLSKSGKSQKFQNYATFKQFIGHSGERDLSVTGKMLASIEVVESDSNHVAIGFDDDEQQDKMKGNDRLDPTWGFSPENARAIDEEVDAMIDEQLAIFDSE